MQLNEWYGWFKETKGELRWFLFVLLLRPVLEGFYELKNISILLSPLYLLGVGVPVAIILTIFTRYKSRRLDLIGAGYIRIFTVLMTAALVLLFVREGVNSRTIEAALKVSFYSMVYLYSSRYIATRRDLDGVLIAFLISSVFPLLTMGYESFVNPINVQMSRGFERVIGIYADPFNYSIYTIMAVAILFYFFRKWSWLKPWILVLAVLSAFFLISKLNHIASWGAFIAIIATYWFSSLKRIVVLVLLAILAIPWLLGEVVNEERMYESQLLGKEYEVLRGERPIEQGFHGRMTRWSYYADLAARMHIGALLFGSYWDFSIHSSTGHIMVPPHNDYIRIIMMSGILGLIAHLVYCAALIRRSMSFANDDRYLLIAVVAVMLAYSISSVPTIYAGFVSIAVPIMASSFLFEEEYENEA